MVYTLNRKGMDGRFQGLLFKMDFFSILLIIAYISSPKTHTPSQVKWIALNVVSVFLENPILI